jgi:hypothetical protein
MTENAIATEIVDAAYVFIPRLVRAYLNRFTMWFWRMN